MLERRREHRRRVCLGGEIAHGFYRSSESVRIRNITSGGVEIITSARLPNDILTFRLPSEDQDRSARIAWHRADRFGLRFLSKAASATSPIPMDDGWQHRFQEIIRRSGRRA